MTESLSVIEQVNQYLEAQANLDILRFITCGSVDDGKSTLIGRMLFEAKLIFDDQVIRCSNAIRMRGCIWRCESKTSKQKYNHSKYEQFLVWGPYGRGTQLSQPLPAMGESKIVCIQKISSRIS